MRRIGVLAGYDDPNMKAFQQELARLGWSDGGNVHIEYRYAPAGSHVQALAKELVALQPDVIFAQSRPVVAALQAESRAIPIVFTAVIDPIGAGFIASLARPGGNITGFMVYEPSVVGKWLAMLKEIAPHLARAALVGNQKPAVLLAACGRGRGAVARDRTCARPRREHCCRHRAHRRSHCSLAKQRHGCAAR
jgi:putative ABC transport system substrate-binding protein